MRVLASTVISAVAGHVVAELALASHRYKHIHDLAEPIFRQNESAIATGAMTLKDIADADMVGCESLQMQALRLKIYQRSGVKDIRLLDRNGAVICSAYAGTLEFDNDVIERSDLHPAQDGLFVFQIEQINGTALGLLRDVKDDRSVVVILSSNSDSVNIIPADLRGKAEVTLSLATKANAQSLPSFSTSTDRITLTRRSMAFPIVTTVEIDRAALAKRDQGLYLAALAAATLLGFVVGLLLVKARGATDDLDEGLILQQFCPFYQPIFELGTRRIVGCEALTRWIRADGSVTPPISFIPLAERSGRIEAMTWQILTRALKELAPLLRTNRAFRVSFNVVPHHLLSVGFIEKLSRIVEDARARPSQIVLEITERNALPGLAAAAAVIAQLQKRGFLVALDDVGVGHNGLSQLQGLGAQIIKIDKFFIDALKRDSAAHSIVNMLVRLAKDMNMTTVAEGIESDDQIAALAAAGVDHGQGYAMAPPLPLADFMALLAPPATTGQDAAAACLVA